MKDLEKLSCTKEHERRILRDDYLPFAQNALSKWQGV